MKNKNFQIVNGAVIAQDKEQQILIVIDQDQIYKLPNGRTERELIELELHWGMMSNINWSLINKNNSITISDLTDLKKSFTKHTWQKIEKYLFEQL